VRYFVEKYEVLEADAYLDEKEGNFKQALEKQI
jgi:hypothetical protein